MAKTSTISATLALVVAATMLFAVADAVSPSAAPGGAVAPSPESVYDFCLPYLTNLSDCMDYVMQGSNLTKPSKACCRETKHLLHVQPKCLCELLAHPGQSPIPIDLQKALRLPSLCKISAPSVSNCSAIGVPIGAPAYAPGHAHAYAPGHAHAPTSGITLPPGGATPSSPTSQPNSGVDRPFTPATHAHFFVGLAVALLVSFF